jgi:hypothetical protein
MTCNNGYYVNAGVCTACTAQTGTNACVGGQSDMSQPCVDQLGTGTADDLFCNMCTGTPPVAGVCT